MSLACYTHETLAAVRRRSPLIHNVTNFVVMNSSANILLAVGAAPVMAHSREEVEEMSAMAGAVVLNIGTLSEDWRDAMVAAAATAGRLGIPVVLDPVGAGATRFRDDAVRRILGTGAVSVVRGNCSEILSLVEAGIRTRGVDSTVGISAAVVDAARAIAADRGCVVAVSGEEDCVTDGVQVFRVGNGHPLMCRVTGTGCGLSAVVAAFLAVGGADPAAAAAAAFGFYGVCGELAAKASLGPGSFQAAFLDQLYSVGKQQISQHLRITKG